MNASNFDDYYGTLINEYYYYNDDLPTLIQISKIVVCYIQPVICMTGFVGNLIAACVFTSKYLRLNSSNLYLATLSCCTCVYMMSVLLVWLEVVGMPIIHQDGICQLVVFVTFVCSFLTVWLVAVITFEHYVIVHHISAARFVCQRRKAKILVSCLILSSVVLYSMSLWSTRVEKKFNMMVCTPGSDKRALLTQVIFHIDMVATLLLPGIITVALICACVSRHLLWKDFKVSCCRHQRNGRISRRERSLLRIARALLMISLSHVLFSSPCFIFRLKYQISTLMTGEDSSLYKDVFVNQILQTLYYLSFTANVLIYVAFCANFRLGLKNIFPLRKLNCFQQNLEETS